MQSRVRSGDAEVGVHHARLHHSAVIFGVDCENSIHACKARDDPALLSQCAPRKAGSGAAPDQRKFVMIRELHTPNHLGRGARETTLSGLATSTEPSYSCSKKS